MSVARSGARAGRRIGPARAAARKLSAAEREAVARFLDVASAAAGEAAEALRTDDKRRRHERRGRSGGRASRQTNEVDNGR